MRRMLRVETELDQSSAGFGLAAPAELFLPFLRLVLFAADDSIDDCAQKRTDNRGNPEQPQLGDGPAAGI